MGRAPVYDAHASIFAEWPPSRRRPVLFYQSSGGCRFDLREWPC